MEIVSVYKKVANYFFSQFLLVVKSYRFRTAKIKKLSANPTHSQIYISQQYVVSEKLPSVLSICGQNF